MTDIIAWLNPGRWLMLLALAGALTLGYFAWADHIGDKREAKVRAQYQKQADAADAARAAVSAPIAAKAEAAQERVRTVYKTIVEKVPVYVKTTDCPMPGGFRVLANAAADERIPDPSELADAAPVEAQAVAASVVGNYGICAQNSQQLRDLQGWVRAQQDLK